tara:strand:+ start:3918 stop:5465 length:1548 start_codon:yes stop_codon:yes gene_type:complete
VLNFTKSKIISIYFIFIILSTFAFFNIISSEKPFLQKKINLGLDLQGGSYLLLEVDTRSLIQERLQDKVLELKKFLKSNNFDFNSFNINQDSINFKMSANQKEKFENTFYSKKNNLINPYIDQYRTHQFDVKIKNENYQINHSKYGLLLLNNSAVKQSIEIVRRRIDDLGTKEPTIVQRGEKRIVVELPGLNDPSRIKNLLGKTAKLTFRLVTNAENEFGSEKMLSEDGSELIVNKQIIMSGENLVDAQPRVDNQSNEPIVSFTLDRYGAKKFGKVTTDNIGKRLAIVLDNKVISAPVIREAITAGSGTISGNFNFQEVTDLSLLLRSGALPTPINIVEERTVGPDLGKDSITSGSISLVVGFILVVLYMFYKYRFFGFIANVSLISNLLMLIGVLTILEATLTLPGIAGIILTVGMAVDANVLIFERIREEMKTEKSVIHAFDMGYSRAKITVLDANITTLLATFILFFFGSGPVKGFAVTLGIGILTTLFSAYFIARHLTSYYVLKNRNNVKI